MAVVAERSSIVRARARRSAAKHGVASLTLELDDPVEVGDLVVVVTGTNTGGLQMLADSTRANAYADAVAAKITPGGSAIHLQYAATVATTAPFSVTSTATTTTAELTMAVHVYRGAAIEPLDQHPGFAVGNDVPPTSLQVTTTRDHELYFAAMSHDGDALSVNGIGYMLRQLPTDDSANVPLATEEKTGAAQTATATFGLSYGSPWICALVTFKPAVP